MRSYLVMGILAGLASTTTAQRNKFEIYPVPVPDGRATTFTSRLGVDNAVGGGKVVQQVPGPLYDRVGDVSAGAWGVSSIFGMEFITQDQDAATIENYSLLILNAARAEFSRAGPFPTPGGVGVRAWLITHVVGALAIGAINRGDWHMGLEFAEETTWPADGQSVHCAAYYAAPGDCPRAGAPHHSFRWTAAAGWATPATERVLRIGVLTAAPILNMGNVNADWLAGKRCFGIGGSYPDTVGGDDLAWRVRAAQAPNGTAFLFFDLWRGGLCLGGIRGTLGLGFPRLWPIAGFMALDAAGNGEVTIPFPAFLRFAGVVPDLHYQALVVDAAFAGLALSNVATVDFP